MSLLDDGACWGDLGGDWMFEMLLIKPIRNILSCFGDQVSEFPLTYRCELVDEAIDKNSGSGAHPPLPKHKPYYKALRMACMSLSA